MERPHYKRFKGTPSEYTSLHLVIKAKLKKPQDCQLCRLKTPRLELANISQNYLKKVSDWMYLCGPCHKRFDSPKYRWVGKGWEKMCSGCKEWKKCVAGFYQRKSTIEKDGRTYPRVDFTSWCKKCTYKKLNPNYA